MTPVFLYAPGNPTLLQRFTQNSQIIRKVGTND
jgi:hypothetical protein